MKKSIYLLLLIPVLFGCEIEKNITGNWGYCEHEKYNEVYINDSTFSFYINGFGFITPLLYSLSNEDNISLFDIEHKMKMKGKITECNNNKIQIILKTIESNEQKVLDLNRITDSIPISSSNNVDDFYEWLNKEFLPGFNVRMSKHQCEVQILTKDTSIY